MQNAWEYRLGPRAPLLLAYLVTLGLMPNPLYLKELITRAGEGYTGWCLGKPETQWVRFQQAPGQPVRGVGSMVDR